MSPMSDGTSVAKVGSLHSFRDTSRLLCRTSHRVWVNLRRDRRIAVADVLGRGREVGLLKHEAVPAAR
jgi:hypothetical protein